MACLIAPAAVATATALIRKKVPAKYQINRLLLMLWGGTAMLLVDHIWSGEIVPYWPFFTAGFGQIMREVWQVGVPMTLAIFAIWTLMLAFSVKTQKPGVLEQKT